MLECFIKINYKLNHIVTGSKNMTESDNCSNCVQGQNCGAVYQQLANSVGPSVAGRVCLAFLLPIAVFIAALAVCEYIWAGKIANEILRIVVSFTSAGAIAFACVLFIRTVTRKSQKNKICISKGVSISKP